MGNITDSWIGDEFDNSPRFLLGGLLDRPNELNPMDIVFLNILKSRPRPNKRPYSHRKDNPTIRQQQIRENIENDDIYPRLDWNEE